MRIRIWDPGSYQPWIRDQGWKKSDPGSLIQDKHSGSATLVMVILKSFLFFPGAQWYAY
jgi:hypothetical protein